MCFTGDLKEDKCYISHVSYAENDKIVTYNSLISAINNIIKGKEKRIKIYAHDLSYSAQYIMAQLRSVGIEEQKRTEEKTENTFSYTYAPHAGFFNFNIYYKGHTIIIVDSKKMAPVKINDICEMFNIEEEDYIKKNIKAVQTIISTLAENGMTKNTIGSSCIDVFKNMSKGSALWWKQMYPDLTKIECPDEFYDTVDEYIRDAYHGGLCYINEQYKGQIVHNGLTIDKNSMYSSVAHSQSGNYLPYGIPRWLKNEAAVKGMMALKQCFIFLQVHADHIKVKDKRIASQSDAFTYISEAEDIRLVLTEQDYNRLIEDYEIKNLKILNGYTFQQSKGFYDAYIDYFMDMKENAPTKGHRKIAKLANNNLWGKFGTRPNRIGAYLREDKERLYTTTAEVLYVPVAAAITSYSRNDLLDTVYKIGYDIVLYTDTDSVHFLGDDTKDVYIDSKKLGAWKVEARWTDAIFYTHKRYIEKTENSYEVTLGGIGETAVNDTVEKLNNGIYTLETLDVSQIKDKIKIADTTGYHYEWR